MKKSEITMSIRERMLSLKVSCNITEVMGGKVLPLRISASRIYRFYMLKERLSDNKPSDS